jgi:type II secretory pathway pseudopilin PulG
VWNKIKIAFGLIIGIAAAIIAFILGRRSDGSGVSRASETAREARNNITTAERDNKELGERIDRSQELAEDIERDNTNALSANRRAQQILRDAKKRSDSKQS